MANKKWLTKKQLAVLDDLFSADVDTEQVLQTHGVTSSLFDKWQSNEVFAAEYNNRINALYRESEFIIAKYAAFAAAKLVRLTESQSQETARKACLDVIQQPKPLTKKQAIRAETDIESQIQQLSPEIASRLLAVLAEQ